MKNAGGINAVPLRDIAAEAAAAFNNGATGAAVFCAISATSRWTTPIASRRSPTTCASRRGYKPVGRKIGFTNRTIWDEYGVLRADLGLCLRPHGARPRRRRCRSPPYSEPRIEPEIMFGLARRPPPGMDDAALLDLRRLGGARL